MIDLETLGTEPDAPIISIGAAWFDLETKTIGKTFYATLDVADQIDSKKRFASAATIKWWMGQSGAARKVFKDDARPSKEVLQLFANWILQTAGASKGSKQLRNVFHGAMVHLSTSLYWSLSLEIIT
jgi:exodeoxyribonuclease VIII